MQDIEAVCDMTEPEVLVPVRCPICMRESLAGFRISVIEDALESGEIRLYADCHVVSWDAGQRELERIREYLDAMWTANPQEVRREMCDLDSVSDEADREIIFEADLELPEVEIAH